MSAGEDPTGTNTNTGAGTEPEPAPRRRRDARRNRDRLVAAAREVFSEQGLDAPLDVIARRAGIGNATLYRHFPARAALVDAVFRDRLTDTMAAGERARAAPDAWTGLNDYLGAVFGTLADDRGTNDLMTTRLPDVEALQAVHAHNRRTVELLLGRGREEGTVRPDVATEDVLFALAALGRAVPPLTAATTPDAWRRPLALFLDGLRAAPPSPLPGRALTGAELGDVLREMGPHRSRIREGTKGGSEARTEERRLRAP
ncbi:TetR/AcrR family transcriptional regulator [Streptomyces sp. NBC_01635]|uniref:TetR/AcrR family transcriptional regulator n=1 Tax=Streptomyces sp. NBC_01635 TaxID=2975904 RepID=UPI003869E2B9|nr:TetR/AcrR family transcriptional regulator [Streptomyces sp. NBC_01635]